MRYWRCSTCGEKHRETLASCPVGSLANSNNPFELGFAAGYIVGDYITNREVSETFPEWTADQIERYQNGRDDGVAGDWWRVKQATAA